MIKGSEAEGLVEREWKRLREAKAVGWGFGIGIQAEDQVVSAVGSGEAIVYST